ncbi:Septum-promoting GTP-binding protein 1-like protein [Drosera capensis]
MAQLLCPKIPDICRRVAVARRYFRHLWDRLLFLDASGAAAASPKPPPRRYEPLPRRNPKAAEGSEAEGTVVMVGENYREVSDLVEMKISLLGDRRIGKTSFLAKYAGNEKQQGQYMKNGGLNYVDKIQQVQGARLFFSIWEVGGDDHSQNHIPTACKDSVAILFMFDLTSRCTLNSIIKWYQEARKWNQTAIPILMGTKFDEFVQLPIDLQWAIASQARAYAKALNATLFFSSSTYNINVNKIRTSAYQFLAGGLCNQPVSGVEEVSLTVSSCFFAQGRSAFMPPLCFQKICFPNFTSDMGFQLASEADDQTGVSIFSKRPKLNDESEFLFLTDVAFFTMMTAS